MYIYIHILRFKESFNQESKGTSPWIIIAGKLVAIGELLNCSTLLTEVLISLNDTIHPSGQIIAAKSPHFREI